MAASTDNIAFVFVPGSFSGPFIFHKVKDVLTTDPYSFPTSSMHDAPLLSATPSRPEGPATMDEDASSIRATLERLADAGKNIVLILCSYGGFPGTEASHGMSKSSRSKVGKTGGIIAMVYLAAYMPSIGDSVISLLGTSQPIETDAYMPLPDYSPEAAQAVFGDLDDEAERESAWSRLNAHSCRSVGGKLKHEGWREVKCWYVFPTLDNVIPPPLQKQYVDKAREQGADIELIEREWSHAPLLGREREVVEIIAEAAGL